MKYIASKLASAVNYAFYTKGANKINVVSKIITINGGADVINKKSLYTPAGIVTEITDEDFEELQTHKVFQKHVKNGFITVVDSEKETKKAVKDMDTDKSSQLTPEDYENGNSKKEIIGGKKKAPRSKKEN